MDVRTLRQGMRVTFDDGAVGEVVRVDPKYYGASPARFVHCWVQVPGEKYLRGVTNTDTITQTV